MTANLNPLPPLWPHQERAAKTIVEALGRVNLVIMEAPVGCLSGDTLIGVNRGGKGKQFRLDDLVHRFNGGKIDYGRPYWNASIPTRVQTADGEMMRLGTLAAAYPSGARETYTVSTKGGLSIRATGEHPFLTLDGWVLLSDLHPGDSVRVLGTQGGRAKKPKLKYKYVGGLTFHPYAASRGQKDTWSRSMVAEHRLIAEAALNDLSLNELIERCRHGDVENLSFLDPLEFHVHHSDHDPKNNRLSNLQVLTPREHRLLHGSGSHLRNVAFPIETDIITSIVPFGEEATYDLSMAEEPHNFIANGFVVHNSGKTFIAEAVRRELFPYRKSVYVCSSIVLQNQVINDPPFSHARLLKGRSNYTPYTRDPVQARRVAEVGATCDDCTWQGRVVGGEMQVSHECDWCESKMTCPYVCAREDAINADLAVLNTDYWLTEANYVGMFSHRSFAIVDEADLLDEKVTSHAEIRISEWRLKRLGVKPPPGKVTGNRTTKTWDAWCDEQLIPALKRSMERLKYAIKSEPPGKKYLDMSRELQTLSGLHGKVARMQKDLVLGKHAGWVRVGDTDSEVLWRPLWPLAAAPEVLWSHASKWLLMSGTIISADEMRERMGWTGPYEAFDVPSVIPAENRLIHFLPVAEMTKNSADEDYEKMCLAVRRLVQYRHPEDRVLVHTVSYAMSRRIEAALQGLGRNIVTYYNARAATEAIDSYKSTPRSVFVASSQERGLDLPGELCRAQIITKTPYLSLGDQHTQARLYASDPSTYDTGQLWYSLEALRRMIQMTGRGIRGIEDHAVTYILDRTFYSKLWRDTEYYAPSWWKEAVQWNPSGDLLRLVGIIPGWKDE